MRRIVLAAVVTFVAGAAFAAPWKNYGGGPQHRAQSKKAAQPLERIVWQTPVDLDPQYTGTDLDIHYGTPLVTTKNTVILPVKTGATDGFRIEARKAATGALVWQIDTDYVLPGHGWVPSCGACLASADRVVAPAAGGTLLVRQAPDRAVGKSARVAFYGIDNYNAQKAQFDGTIYICTPITSDAKGNVYFGFLTNPGAPMGIVSGFAKVTPKGQGAWTSAVDASGDPTISRPLMNCAPAISADGKTVYVVARSSTNAGSLCALDSKSLAPRASVRLKDPVTPLEDAYLSDDGTASPTIGPDGDVYFGVIEGNTTFNFFRGWLLHFNAGLTLAKFPGSFGWDDTASVIPASAVPSYDGPSKYLLLTKANDYVETGGTGINRLTVIDPGQATPYSCGGYCTPVSVMKEILAVTGPTPDADSVDLAHPNAVREWCINTAAIDVKGHCAMVNNEDGILYRWDFATNTLSQSIVLTSGLGEAYTPTVIGPDGTVYAINNAVLFAVGRAPKQ
jgi:hypothetical protein